jgi:hypothetical protein
LLSCRSGLEPKKFYTTYSQVIIKFPQLGGKIEAPHSVQFFPVKGGEHPHPSLYQPPGGKNKSHRDCLKNPTEPAASFFWPLIPPPLELYNIYKRRKMNFFLSFLIHIRFF